jgi:hypothetical protein
MDDATRSFPMNRRRFERFSLRPMYTSVSLHRRGDCQSHRLDGHAYDICEGGLSVEVDEAVAPGERVAVEIDLPGCPRVIRADGEVVRLEDDFGSLAADRSLALIGPARVAVRFDRFATDEDLPTLRRYLGQGWLQRAA